MSWAGDVRLTATPGATVGLSLWVGDNLSPRCRIGVSAVTDGHSVSATHLGTVVTHVTPRRVTLTWTCPARLGTYYLLLSVRDRARNESVVTASLVVR